VVDDTTIDENRAQGWVVGASDHIRWANGVVVSRLICIQKVRGSNPRWSILSFFHCVLLSYAESCLGRFLHSSRCPMTSFSATGGFDVRDPMGWVLISLLVGTVVGARSACKAAGRTVDGDLVWWASAT
jgi:hypothetical protein